MAATIFSSIAFQMSLLLFGLEFKFKNIFNVKYCIIALASVVVP